ncbi:hypothetical protein L1987_82127 [Smallanthus sonchifolius]|uniref:Uncharacterized protein n=1 Tax=Smallanthus sonchifolius TaxID=185202 RepID=A0ACB8YST1_9ASTR|nr:hypothetical protein L1987_82127 [Smallanthus sonchifolius]
MPKSFSTNTSQTPESSPTSCSFQKNFIDYALSIFRHSKNPNIYIFNSLIRALADNSYFMTSISYFLVMLRSNIRPNTLTFPFVLKSTAALQEGWLGMQIHTQIFKSCLLRDRLVLLYLVDMYAKVGLLESASQVFDESSQWGDEARSTLLWNVLINGHCKVGKWVKAMELFEVMPEKYGSTWSTLINGLMKAGEINRAMELWDSVEERNVVSWTTMINGFSQNGQHEKALSMFTKMLEEGVEPNDQTIVCALLDCAKAGALDTGTRIHDYILSNGFTLNKGITAALVDIACRAHKNIQMAEYASEKLLELEPKHPGGYVFLSNVYAGAGKWQEVERVRTKMKNKGVAKDPGWSYIEIDGQVTSFVAGDHFHDRSDEIHLKLDEITKNARESGYMPETEWVLHNIEEEEKESSLGSHSKKLALAFALIAGDDLKVIRIVKNLKICGDCHSLMKYASKMTKRDIVVRDIKRFHHFKNGSCSCQDYW